MFHHHPYHKGPIFGTVVKDELPLKPGRHNTPDLVERLLKRIDVVSPPSSKDKDVSEARADVSEAMSSLGAYVAIQTNDNDHRFELETFKGNEYNKFLMKLFEASKVIFSVNELPSTKVSEALGHEFPPADLIVHRITTNKLSRFAAEIKIRGKERSWDHIGALLGAMLELYFKYYGCDCIMCRQHDQGYGLGEGHAWQEIAHKLETSDILQVKIREFFPNSGPIDLFRKQLYIEELSYYWKLPEYSVEIRLVLEASGWYISRLDHWFMWAAWGKCQARERKREQEKEKEEKKTCNYLKKLIVSRSGAST